MTRAKAGQAAPGWTAKEKTMAAKNQNTVVTATQKTEPGAKKDALAAAIAPIFA